MLTPRRSFLARVMAVFAAACVALSPGGDTLAEDGRDRETTATVDFENDLIPVFTRFGCNTGACHGAAIGRGGFKLSLFGSNPDADHEAIVHELEGARVNLARPTESLLVLKPTESITHGGGQRFGTDHEAAQLITGWIRQGTRRQALKSLVRVQVTPRRRVVESLDQTVTITATAHYSDGSRRDVTSLAVLIPEDSSAVSVKPGSGRVRISRRGRHIVVVRFLTEVVPVELLVPLREQPVDLSLAPSRGFIDDEILKTLATLRLEPAPACDDATFLRRVTLDLTGRLPTPTEARSFLANRRDGKRVELVERLLASDAFTEYWTLQFARLLRIRPQARDTQGAETYHRWLARQVGRKTGLDRLARELVLGTGDSHEVGPANFYRATNDPRKQAELASEFFMGTRLRCANCHDHPLDRWTQDDYHGLAAIFARIETGRVIRPKPSGRVIHPRTLEVAGRRIPGQPEMPDTSADGLKRLANWLTHPDNPYFARAMVNRLWKSMMGRGLVEPADDFRDTNPPTHPRLLDRLASDFVEHEYHIRHTLKQIAISHAYARVASPRPDQPTDDRFHSHAIRESLEPEVLADALADVLGISERYGELPDGTRAVTLINPKTPSLTLEILGRCDREISCESSLAPTDGLPRQLHLLNGPLINARLSAPGSRLALLLKAKRSPHQIIDTFFVAALGRHPRPREMQFLDAELLRSPGAEGRREFLEDFVWSLLSCREFLTNH